MSLTSREVFEHLMGWDKRLIDEIVPFQIIPIWNQNSEEENRKLQPVSSIVIMLEDQAMNNFRGAVSELTLFTYTRRASALACTIYGSIKGTLTSVSGENGWTLSLYVYV